MKILVVTQYFWPEEFRINDLAINLVEKGHDVTVLTGNPNYPKGKFYAGYGFVNKVEYYEGIKIFRVPILPRGENKLSLVLNYFSFLLSGSVFSFFHKEKYDKVFAVNFSPITSVIPAIVYSKRNSVKLYLWVQDLWPESVTATVNINSKFLLFFLTKLVKYIYNNSHIILVQSKGFVESIAEKNININKIRYLPNWAENLYSTPGDKKKYYDLIPKGGFVVMFAGNIGEGQDFDSILKAVQLTTKEKLINWVVIGDGRKMKWLKQKVKDLGLENNLFLLGRYPVTEMPDFFTHADVMLLSLKKEKIFSLTIPSKIQSYMSFGKPIIGMLDGVGAEVINESNCGFHAGAGDYKLLYKNVMLAFNKSTSELKVKGINGKKYYKNNFSKNKVMEYLITVFKES